MGIINEELRDKAIEYREASDLTVAAFAELIGVERSAVSTYLNENAERLSQSKIDEIEENVQRLLKADSKVVKHKGVLKTHDLVGATFVCQSCQETKELGLIYGKAGLGKTYSLRNFEKLPRVIYIECSALMLARDILDQLEDSVGLSRGAGTLHHRLNKLRTFFDINRGYLIIFDEADKLLTQHAQKKMETVRFLSDCRKVGVVVAGEPALRGALERLIPRFRDRTTYFYEMKGLTKEEAIEYISDVPIQDEAKNDMIYYGINGRDGSFRRLYKTLKNSISVADGGMITKETITKAREFML